MRHLPRQIMGNSSNTASYVPNIIFKKTSVEVRNIIKHHWNVLDRDKIFSPTRVVSLVYVFVFGLFIFVLYRLPNVACISGLSILNCP